MTSYTQVNKPVVIPAETFRKVELLIEEVPALRQENADLKAEVANARKIEAKDAQIIQSLRNELTATQKALDSTETARIAESKRADENKLALEATQAALKISEAEKEKARKSAKKWKRRAVIAIIGGIAITVLRGGF